MTSMQRTGLGLLSILAAALGGCDRPMPKTQVPLSQLVAEYNRNAEAVPMVAAYADIEFTAYHESTGVGMPVWSSPNGLLRMSKGPEPFGTHDMVLIGRELSKQVIRVGTSRKDDIYYMWTLVPETKAMWGHMKYAGAPGIENMTIDPSGLQAILGICQLPYGSSKDLGVTLRMDTTPGRYAYIVGYINRQPISNRLILSREYRFTWDEERPDGLSEFLIGKQKPRRVEEISFFDPEGRKLIRAEVSDYKPVELDPATDEPETAPIMPTNIRITWYNRKQQKKYAIRLKLSQMTTEEIWDIEVCDFLENVPDEIEDYQIVQVDKGLAEEQEDQEESNGGEGGDE